MCWYYHSVLEWKIAPRKMYNGSEADLKRKRNGSKNQGRRGLLASFSNFLSILIANIPLELAFTVCSTEIINGGLCDSRVGY